MRRFAFAVLLAAALPRAAAAQSANTIAIRLAITDVALTVVTTRPLEFGAVVPGVATTVDPRTAATAGEFELRGLRNAEFTATFTLPAELRVGPFGMPVSFGPQSGCGDRDDRGSNCRYFDPRVPYTARIANRPAPRNAYFISLGGTVAPAVGQQPGFYRGTIVIEFAYTGN